MKFFDYKFIILLGLSVVVYFLYREIEQLNKRINTLENKKQLTLDHITDDMLELPPPPKQATNNIEHIHDARQYHNVKLPNEINIPYNITLTNESDKPNVFTIEEHIKGTLEEYSNDDHCIYSNDTY